MNKKRKPKIFHGLVNYGTQAGNLSMALRELGYHAYSVTNIDIFERQSDLSFQRKKSILEKLIFYKIVYPFIKIRCFFQFDIFHFYFGKTLFDSRFDLYFYKLFGKKVVMEYLGNDIRPYEKLVKKFDLEPPHPFTINPKFHDDQVRRRIKFERKKIDYMLVCLPIYFSHAKYYELEIDGLLNLAVPLPQIKEYKLSNQEIVIMHAPTSRKFKGTKYFQAAVSRLKMEGHNIRFEILENMPHRQLLQQIGECHIFCDQISEGWYGTVAIEAMALGKPTCAFLDEEYLEYCDFRKEIPILNTSRENVYEVLLNCILEKEKLINISKRSREFVEKYHGIESVALKAVEVYNKIWPH